MDSKVQKLLTGRRQSGVAQIRKQQHEAEINFMQQKFRSKLSKLQKYLITRKQFVNIDIYARQEDVGTYGILKPIFNTNHRHKGKIDGSLLSKDEHDEQLDKIMTKILPKYDIKKMIQKETEEQQHLQRRKIIGNMVDVMETKLKEKERELIYEYEMNDLVDEKQQHQLQYEYMEEKSHFRTLQLMLDQEDLVSGQILSDENEFQNRNQVKNYKHSKFKNSNQKVKSEPRAETSPVKPEKLEEINAKTRSKLLITSHLHRLGVLTQKESLMKCDSLRDTRGRLKVPQTNETVATTNYFVKTRSSQLSTKPSGWATVRTLPKNTCSQVSLGSFSHKRIATEQTVDHLTQDVQTLKLQSIFSQCSSMKGGLKREKKQMKLKMQRSQRNFSNLESKLYDIKTNNFLTENMMINI